MVILPDQKVIVVATPRTGSRSIRDGLKSLRIPRCTVTGVHHEFPHEVAEAKKKGPGYEVWTMIREPISQLKSWISHLGSWDDPMFVIQSYRSRYFMYEGGMNIYNQVADRYFLFEDNGHEKIFEELGFPERHLKIVGKTDSGLHGLSTNQINAAKQRFAKDFELYEREKEKWYSTHQSE